MDARRFGVGIWTPEPPGCQTDGEGHESDDGADQEVPVEQCVPDRSGCFPIDLVLDLASRVPGEEANGDEAEEGCDR